MVSNVQDFYTSRALIIMPSGNLVRKADILDVTFHICSPPYVFFLQIERGR